MKGVRPPGLKWTYLRVKKLSSRRSKTEDIEALEILSSSLPGVFHVPQVPQVPQVPRQPCTSVPLDLAY